MKSALTDVLLHPFWHFGKSTFNEIAFIKACAASSYPFLADSVSVNLDAFRMQIHKIQPFKVLLEFWLSFKNWRYSFTVWNQLFRGHQGLPPPALASIFLSIPSPTVKWTAMVNSQTDPSPSVSTEEEAGMSEAERWGLGGARDVDGERESERDRATPEGWVSCDREWCPLPLLLSPPSFSFFITF